MRVNNKNSTYNKITIITFYFCVSFCAGSIYLIVDKLMPFTEGNQLPWWWITLQFLLGASGIYFISRLDKNDTHDF